MGRITARKRVVRWQVGRGGTPAEDTVTVEEPLEIRVGGTALTVTMRTPGDDIELAHGLLLSEGVIRVAADVITMRYCAGATVDDDTGYAKNTYNVLDVALAPGVLPPGPARARTPYMTSACGLCGSSSIEAVRTMSAYGISGAGPIVGIDLLASLPERLRARQQIFAATGGLHAAGLVDARSGELLAVREDVGRHNAVDKVIGWALTARMLPLRDALLVVSSRASFELAQKAWMAGIPLLAAVSAPSSLAIELADEVGMTLVGFLRGDSMVVYAGSERVSDVAVPKGAATSGNDATSASQPVQEGHAV